MIEESDCISFDNAFSLNEQLPRQFSVLFEEIENVVPSKVKVTYNNKPIGDMITDNSYENDFYRYHDIFHYTFATLLEWSPCTRSLMHKKRKSNVLVDEVEDGARATITEEAISLIIFNEAKRKNFFKYSKNVSKITLHIIKEMTDNFEVRLRTSNEWEQAILKSYKIFRLLIGNNGGRVNFDMQNKSIEYFAPAN